MASDTPDRPRLTLFAGPNGAGKTTAYRRFVDAAQAGGDRVRGHDHLSGCFAGSLAGSRHRRFAAGGVDAVFVRGGTIAVETNRIVGANVVVNSVRKGQKLRTILT